MFRLLLAAPLLAIVLFANGCATHKEEKKCTDKCCAADTGSTHHSHATHGKTKSQ